MDAARICFILSAVFLATSTAQIIDEIYNTNFKTVFNNLEDKVAETTIRSAVYQNEDGEACTCVAIQMCNSDETNLNISGIIINKRTVKMEICQSPSETCCLLSNIRSVPLEIPVTPNLPCGIRNKDGIGFVVKGFKKDESQFGEFPWTAVILKKVDNGIVCGASIIHPMVLLTAAHCIQNEQKEELKIRAGEWDTQTIKEPIPFQERTIAFAILHPAYNNGSMINDIAILILQTSFIKSDHINAVCLPPHNHNFVYDKNCIATGWGKKSFNLQGRYAAIMKKIEMDIVNYNTCNLALKSVIGENYRLSRTSLCAGGTPGKDTCQGDGGGPLVCSFSDGRYYLAGLSGWGISCGSNIPGVYTYVSRFREWIESIINGYGLYLL